MEVAVWIVWHYYLYDMFVDLYQERSRGREAGWID